MSSNYFRYTTTLCVYHLQPEMIRQVVHFPYVRTLALVRCPPTIIPSLLQPSIFPSLKEIHYLSGHPGSSTLHRHLSSSVSWIFPNYSYSFYDTMVESGYGMKSDTLLSNYLSKETATDFELYIPQYTIMDGNLYRSKLVEYIHSLRYHSHVHPSDSIPRIRQPAIQHAVSHPIDLYLKKQTETSFLRTLQF
jgi:hypothetical protein